MASSILPVELAIRSCVSLEALALQAAETLSLSVAGIDIIESYRGPLLLEANSSPGLEGIERATQRDVAGAIVTYLEEQADIREKLRRRRTRRRSR